MSPEYVGGTPFLSRSVADPALGLDVSLGRREVAAGEQRGARIDGGAGPADDGRMRIIALLLPIALIILAAPARADQVRFTGRTSVDDVVIRDALQNVLRVAAAREQCNQLSAVEARVLPADYRPTDPAYRVGPADTRYERWDATLCGRVVPFLLGFWSAPEGGTMFQIGYPYPADPMPTPR